MTSSDLSELIERLKRWFWPRRLSVDDAALSWHCQCAGHPFSTDPCAAYLHIAKSRSGTFEIFEEGGWFLLHFPRSMQLPAALFHSLGSAKAAARTALQKEQEGRE